jgi:hypothetical protein
MRFHAPEASTAFGPLNAPYELRLPVTFGYNPLPLRRYMEYKEIAASNPQLLNGLLVGSTVDMQTGQLLPNPNALPRFYFPATVRSASGKGALATVNPRAEAILEGSADGVQQDGSASVEIKEAGAERYVLRTTAKTPSLLRSAIPWFPAWRATVDGAGAPVRIADHAMAAVVVPAGQHDVVLEYNASRFRTGALMSAAAALAVIAALLWLARRERPTGASLAS